MNIKNQLDELEDLKNNLNKNEKEKLIDKLLKSEKIDKVIIKLQKLYNNISEKLFVKYDLKNELKQGKIFTILVATLIFIYLIIITIFFFVMLNSLLGLNFIFSILKYSIFFLKWGYTILKSKGNLIMKYLANLFPNSKLITENNKQKMEGLPIFETEILKEIQELTYKLEKLDIDISLIKEFAIRLKEIVNMLNLENEEFLLEFKSLEYKNEIIKQLMKVKNEISEIELKIEKEKKFIEVKIDTLDNINKIYDDNRSTKTMKKNLKNY